MDLSPILIAPDRNGNLWQCPVKLPSNQAYFISFDYEITRNPDHDLDTNNPGYFRFYAMGDSGERIGEARWFDKADQPSASKTFMLATESAEEYRLFWESVGMGEMLVSNIRIERIKNENIMKFKLNSNDFLLDKNASYSLHFGVIANRDRSQVKLPDDWYDFLNTNPEKVKLEPNTAYTVWFNCAARPQIWQGDYFYLKVVSKDTSHNLFRWTQRHTTNPVRRAYSFYTGEREDCYLVWGIKNGGQCSISQVFITRR